MALIEALLNFINLNKEPAAEALFDKGFSFAFVSGAS